MSHTHSFKEVTQYGHNEQHFRCVFCGAETTKPFPKVNPYTGVIESDAQPFTRLDVGALRELAEMMLLPAWSAKRYFLESLANRIEVLLPPKDDPPSPDVLEDYTNPLKHPLEEK